MKVFAVLVVVFAITVATEAHVRKHVRKTSLDTYDFVNDSGDQCVCTPQVVVNSDECETNPKVVSIENGSDETEPESEEETIDRKRIFGGGRKFYPG